MTDGWAPRLAGRRVLVVEDEYILAEDLRRELLDVGAEVVGPAPGVAAALRLLAEAPPDAAILDINLGPEMAYPVADRLRALGVPFVFATGYDASEVAARYAGVPHVDKPVDLARCVTLLDLRPAA